MTSNPEEEEEIVAEAMFSSDAVDPLADPLALDEELVNRSSEFTSGSTTLTDLDSSGDGQIMLVDVNSLKSSFPEIPIPYSSTFAASAASSDVDGLTSMAFETCPDLSASLPNTSVDDGIAGFEPIALALDDENNEEIEGARSDGSDSGLGLELSSGLLSEKTVSAPSSIGAYSLPICVEFVRTSDSIPVPAVSATSTPSVVRSNLKRRSDPNDPIDAIETKKPKRNIQFSNVTVYYFPRIQGFTCIPSQGGCTLGMGPRHYDQKSFTLSEHSAEQKRLHRLKLVEQKPRSLAALAMLAPTPAPTPVIPPALPIVAPASATTTVTVSASVTSAAGASPAAATADERSRSSTEESDSEEEVLSENSSSEFDTETNGFLQPVPQRQRRALLKAAGVREIASFEKNECRDIRLSREFCGCNCRDYCDPETCFCSQSGIKCQVDRASFPCGCTQDGCGNVFGRIEFNPKRVRTHFIHTIMRLEMEKKQKKSDKQNSLNTYDGRLRLRDSDDDCPSLPTPGGVTQHRQSLDHLANFRSSDAIYSMSPAVGGGAGGDLVDGSFGSDCALVNRSAPPMADNPLDLHFAFRSEYQVDITTPQDQSTPSYSLYGSAGFFPSTPSAPFDDFTGLAQSSQPPEITTPYSSFSNNIYSGLLSSTSSDLIDNVAASCSYVSSFPNENRDVSISNGLFENVHEEMNVLPLAPTLQFDMCSRPCSVVLNRLSQPDCESKNLLESATELSSLLQSTSNDEITTPIPVQETIIEETFDKLDPVIEARSTEEPTSDAAISGKEKTTSECVLDEDGERLSTPEQSSSEVVPESIVESVTT